MWDVLGKTYGVFERRMGYEWDMMGYIVHCTRYIHHIYIYMIIYIYIYIYIHMCIQIVYLREHEVTPENGSLFNIVHQMSGVKMMAGNINPGCFG